jgi:wyosine [tRNA(Phe)-imidazoG37] synthetase (radical SAM superfamily)
MGRSRQRLGRDHVPTHADIDGFARTLARRTGYSVLDESPESKVFLLGTSNEGRYLPGLAPEAAAALG